MAAPLAAIFARIGSGVAARVGARGTAAKLARRAAQRERLARMRIPVADRTKGMNWAGRMARLRRSNRLQTRERVAKDLNIKDPGAVLSMQQVQRSEKTEEQQRLKGLKQQQGTGMKNPLPSGLKLITAGAMLPIVFKKLGDACDRLATRIMENQRDLRKYSPQIHATFMRLSHQQRVLGIERAGATSGSTARLGESLMELRREMEPLRRGMTTAVNYLGMIATRLGIGVAVLLKMSPAGKLILKQLEEQEKEDKKKQKAQAEFFRQWVGGIDQGPGVRAAKWKDRAIQRDPGDQAGFRR